MLQTSNLSSALPACGVALSLARCGAAAKDEAATNAPADSAPKATAVEKAPELTGRTFYQFTDIDFRKILGVPIRESLTDTLAASKPESSAAIRSAISELKAAKNSDVPRPEGGGGGVMLMAAAPLIGTRTDKESEKSKGGGFFKRLLSGGGPEPEKDPKSASDDRKSGTWAAREVEPEKHPGFCGGIWSNVKTLWKLWERPCDLLPSPWNTVVKWGVPAAAAGLGVIFYSAVLQTAIVGAQLFGGLLQPIAGAAGFLVPMVAADPIMKGIEKLFKLEPKEGWRRQAILRPAQAGLLAGAAIWIAGVDLAPVTYGLWTAAAVGAGYLASKCFKSGSARMATWTAVAAAVTLPWTHLTTQRTFDVTVLNAGPDPEVAAWNVTTDLSKMDHWKKVAFFGQQKEPTGKPGMVFLNRDVPLYIPSHREANSFNGHFENLSGQRVRITTIGVWAKMLSPKFQPTIVKYQVLGPANASTNAPTASATNDVHLK